jgi:hypothetical protein
VSNPSRSDGAEPAPASLVAVSDKLWTAFHARDWDAIFELTTDDFALSTDPQWPGGGEFATREELLRFLEQFLDPWEELRYVRRGEPALVGGRLVERGGWVGVGRSTGIEGTIEFTLVTTVENGLLKRSDYFIDHDQALAFAATGVRGG